VPFNEKTYRNLPQLDVEAFVAETGRIPTPQDIIEASKLGDNSPFASDATIVGFAPGENKNGSIVMDPKVKLDKDGKGGTTAELPITWEAVKLVNAQEMIPDGFEQAVNKKTGKQADQWLALVGRGKAPSGEFTWVMLTGGEFLLGDKDKGVEARTDDFLKWTRGEGAMLMPMTRMVDVGNDKDVFGSVQAKWTANGGFNNIPGEGYKQLEELTKMMSRLDLTKPEDLAQFQEFLNKHYLFMGKTEDQFIQIVE